VRTKLAATIGLVLALGAARYIDPTHRFHFAIPAGCTSAAGAKSQPDVVSCNNGTARVMFAAGGSDEPALQRLVNRVIRDWTNLKLIANDRRATLDHRPARSLFAVGVRPDHAIANIQIVAVAKDGGWYALVTESSAWPADSKRYFEPMSDSFHFD